MAPLAGAARARALDVIRNVFELGTSADPLVDPWTSPFTPNIPCRMILYPVPFELEDDQFVAISKAAEEIGDREMFITATELEGPDIWAVTTSDMKAYTEAVSASPPVETAYVGSSGLWGLIVSHEDHAVVGGPRRFIEKLADDFAPSTSLTDATTPAAAQVDDFLAAVRGWRASSEGTPDWLPELLRHVYGDARSEELLRSAGFTSERGA